MSKKRKLIDLSEAAVKILTKAAIDADTVFKLYVEHLLEEKAKELNNKNEMDKRN